MNDQETIARSRVMSVGVKLSHRKVRGQIQIVVRSSESGFWLRDNAVLLIPTEQSKGRSGSEVWDSSLKAPVLLFVATLRGWMLFQEETASVHHWVSL
jgi:hypothetical protein